MALRDLLPWRPGRWPRWAALVLLAALVLAGCGGLPPTAGTRIPPAGGAAEATPVDPPPGPPDLAGWTGPRARGRLPAPPPSSSESPVSGRLDLEPGWNLVSFPVARVTGVDPGAGVLGTAFAWDPGARSYQAVDLQDPAALASGEEPPAHDRVPERVHHGLQARGAFRMPGAHVVPGAGVAYGAFLLRQYYRTLPLEVLDAAKVDGAGHLRTLGAIVAPLAKPAIISFALLSIVSKWNDFLWPLIVTNTRDMRVLPIGIAPDKNIKVPT